MLIIALIPMIAAVAGVLCYALASNGKVAEIGRLVFWTSWLVLMFHVAGRVVKIG